MTLALWVVIGVGLLEAGATWWLVRASRRLAHVDERLGQLTEAVRLLTETTEAGFRASAAELAHVAEEATRARRPVKAQAPVVTAAPEVAAEIVPARPRARRPAAARSTRPAKNVLGAEEMSEAELRLRLHLAETGAARAASTRETGRALRA